jgi:hypothetical protein
MSANLNQQKKRRGIAIILITGVPVLSSLLLSAGLRLHINGSLTPLNIMGIIGFALLFLALLSRRVWARWALVALLGAAGLSILSRTLPVMLSGATSKSALLTTTAACTYLVCAGVIAGSKALDTFLTPRN